MSTKGGVPPPTWDAFLKALVSTRDQGFDLVQLVLSVTGDGFETITATVRKPSETERK